MNAPSKDNLDADGDELSTVDDDFDSLLKKEDIGIGSEKGKHNLSFNELFEQISEECTESVEGLAGDSAEGNVDDDFEALLNDQDIIVSFPNNEEKKDLENENLVGRNAGKDDDPFGDKSFEIAGDISGGNVDDDFEALLNDHIVTDLDNENFSKNNAGKDDDLLGKMSFGIERDSTGGNVDDEFEALLNDQDHIESFQTNEAKQCLDNEYFFVNNAGKDDDHFGEKGAGLEGDSPVRNVDDDFEALLNDQDNILSFSKNEAKKCMDIENVVVKNADKDDDLLGKISNGKGFSQIFSTDDSQEFLQNSSDEIKTMNFNVDPELGKSLAESSVLEERTYQDKIEALNKLLIEERSSFQHDLKKKEIEASKLKAEIEKLRGKVKIIETDKDAAEEKIFNLFEKQKINSHITEVKEMSSDKEAELISQIQILKEKIEVQDDIIVEIQEDNTLIRNKNGGILDKKKNINYNSDDEDKPEDPKQKIVLLENELEDQKQVSEKLKAYVGDVLENIMVTNPQMLERK